MSEHLLRSVRAMRHDRQLLNEWDETAADEYPRDGWFEFHLWLTCYAPGHKTWSRISLWWHYNVRRYPKPPPLDQDPVFRKLFGEAAEKEERG